MAFGDGLLDGAFGAQHGGDLPVFLRLERLDLALALDDQPHGHRLHPAGAQVLGHLLAQQRAELVADDAVEEAARFLGGDAVHVDRAGVRERLLHRASW